MSTRTRLALTLLTAGQLLPLGATARPQEQELELELKTARPPVRASQPLMPAQQAALLQRLSAARSALEALRSTKVVVSAVGRISLLHELERIEQILRARKPACNPTPEVSRLERDLAIVAAGGTAHRRPGLHRLAYRSTLDGRVHGYVVYVPRGHVASRSYPLVVMLHGMMSTPMRGIGRLFGVAEAELTDEHTVCDRPQLGDQPPLVVAPGGFGDALYRGPGALDVKTVVNQVLRLYRVDRRRITITGLSMGGTGAAELAFQQPQRYAGILALCGYYDRRLDSSSRGQPLLPWERHLLTVHSPVDWAENAGGIPLTLIHGTLDGPERAQALERRYQQLGLPVTVELFPRGHDVWVPGYQGGRAFKLLARHRRGASPRQVKLVTARPRVRRAHWVLIQRFIDHGVWARVEAQIKDRTHVEVATRNVAALRLDLPASYLDSGQPILINIDGTALSSPPVSTPDRPGQRPSRRRGAAPRHARWTRPIRLARGPGGWIVATADPAPLPGLVKRPGLSGPIEDIYNDPVIVVYGTGGGQAGALRAVARQLAAYKKRVTLRYPVIPDRSFSARRARGHAVILVGNEQNNRVLARLGPQLPIRVGADEVRLGSKVLRGTDIGATFVFPNPDAPDRYLRVVGGTTAGSYRLVLKDLPLYLPDYVVFDDQISARGRRGLSVVGKDRKFVAAGSFDERWTLGAAPRAPTASP